MRKRTEEESRGMLLEKLKRWDVKEDLDLLQEDEKEELKRYHEILKRLTAHQQRLDCGVCLLRDFN